MTYEFKEQSGFQEYFGKSHQLVRRSGSGGFVASLGSLNIALPPIVRMGTEEQKIRFLPQVLAGEKIAALAITEPGGGSDVANIQTTALRAIPCPEN
jgi:acyl-CoA dehydrogenase